MFNNNNNSAPLQNGAATDREGNINNITNSGSTPPHQGGVTPPPSEPLNYTSNNRESTTTPAAAPPGLEAAATVVARRLSSQRQRPSTSSTAPAVAASIPSSSLRDTTPLLALLLQDDPSMYTAIVQGEGPVEGGVSLNRSQIAPASSLPQWRSAAASSSNTIEVMSGSMSRRVASFFELQDRPKKTLNFEEVTVVDGEEGWGERMNGLLAAVSLPEQAAMEIALDILDPMQIPGAYLNEAQVAQFFALMGISIESHFLDELLRETWGYVRGGQYYLQDLLQVYTWWRGVGCTRLPAPPKMTDADKAELNEIVNPSKDSGDSLRRSNNNSNNLLSTSKVDMGKSSSNNILEEYLAPDEYSIEYNRLRRSRQAISPIVGYDEEVSKQLGQLNSKSVVQRLHDQLELQLHQQEIKAEERMAACGIVLNRSNDDADNPFSNSGPPPQQDSNNDDAVEIAPLTDEGNKNDSTTITTNNDNNNKSNNDKESGRSRSGAVEKDKTGRGGGAGTRDEGRVDDTTNPTVLSKFTSGLFGSRSTNTTTNPPLILSVEDSYGSLVGDTNAGMGLPWFHPNRIWLIDSQPRVMFNVGMVVVALAYYITIMARNTSFVREFHYGWLVADTLITLLYILDVHIWTRTAVLDDRTGLLVQQPKLIRLWYLKKGWMVADVVACLPIDIILYCIAAAFEEDSSTRNTLGIASGVFNHLRALKSIRLAFAFRITGQTRFTQFYLEFFSNYLPIMLEFTAVFYTVVNFAMFYVLAKYLNGTLSSLGTSPFVTSLYFVVQTLSTVGYGDLPIGGVGETVFIIVLMVFSLIGNGVVIGRLMGLVMRPSVDSIRQDNLRQLLAVLKFFRIPKPLQVEILNFQGHVLWTDLSSTFENQLAPLPLVLRENVETVRRVRVLYNVPLFRLAHDAVIVALSAKMQWRTYRPEEYISFAGEPHNGIRFVMFGFIDVLMDSGRYLRTIKKGDVFGVHDLLNRGALSGSAAFPLRSQRHSYKSISYADVYALSPEDLFEVATEFPRFGDQFSFSTTRDKSVLYPPASSDDDKVHLKRKRNNTNMDKNDEDVGFDPATGLASKSINPLLAPSSQSQIGNVFQQQQRQSSTAGGGGGGLGGGGGAVPFNSFSTKKVSFLPSSSSTTTNGPLINFGPNSSGWEVGGNSGGGGWGGGGDEQKAVTTEAVSTLRQLIDGLMEDLNGTIQQEEEQQPQ